MKKTLVVLAVLFSFAAISISCKETKKEEVKIESEDTHANEGNEMVTAAYQCPMDCEKGKTYGETGNCPVCKMELRSLEKDTENAKHAENCKCMESGDCTCEGGKCVCQAEVVSSSMECTKCEPGKCTCKAEVMSPVKEKASCSSKRCCGKA